jgi:hypothetical protein
MSGVDMARDDIKEIARGHGGIIEMIGNFLPKINETGVLDTQSGSLEDFRSPA